MTARRARRPREVAANGRPARGAARAGPPISAPRPRAHAVIPAGVDRVEIRDGGRQLPLTNLRKIFWPELGLTKGDLLRHYADMAPVLLPHLAGRAMVMKRYPDGAGGPFFFMKRAPSPRPDWIETCSIEHASGSVIDFPIVQDLLSLLWVVNLGCIDLNPWYARCDDTDRPDYLHFDLDPVKGASFEQVREAALVLREALDGLGHAERPEDHGLARSARLRAHRARPDPEGGVDGCEGARPGAGRRSSGPPHRGVPHRPAAGPARPRRLQPERLGPHARLRILGAAPRPGPPFPRR